MGELQFDPDLTYKYNTLWGKNSIASNEKQIEYNFTYMYLPRIAYLAIL